MRGYWTTVSFTCRPPAVRKILLRNNTLFRRAFVSRAGHRGGKNIAFVNTSNFLRNALSISYTIYAVEVNIVIFTTYTEFVSTKYYITLRTYVILAA